MQFVQSKKIIDIAVQLCITDGPHLLSLLLNAIYMRLDLSLPPPSRPLSSSLVAFLSFPLSQKILGSHEEIEELLESHLMDCNSLSEKLAYLMVTMQNAEDLVSSSVVCDALTVRLCWRYYPILSSTITRCSIKDQFFREAVIEAASYPTLTCLPAELSVCRLPLTDVFEARHLAERITDGEYHPHYRHRSYWFQCVRYRGVRNEFRSDYHHPGRLRSIRSRLHDNFRAHICGHWVDMVLL